MVKYNNQWGTVCDDGILPTESASKSALTAQSACHTLGLSGGVIELYNGNTHGPEGPIMMDSVNCASSTTNFLQCSHDSQAAAESSCGHHEDVFLTCT